MPDQFISVTAPEGVEAGQEFQVPIDQVPIANLIPEDLKDREYLKKIDSVPSLFKSFDNAQEVLGKKRYGVPAVDATDEEWDEYFATSRPESADKYEFVVDENIPDEIKASEEVQGKMKELLFQAGISPRQAQILQKGFDAMNLDIFNAGKEKREQMDKEFDELTTKTLGEDKEEKIAFAKKLIESEIPKELASHLANAPNEVLVAMAAFANNIKAKYINEDKLPDDGGGITGKTNDELRAEAKAMMAEAMKLDAMDPRKAELHKKASEIYRIISTKKQVA